MHPPFMTNARGSQQNVSWNSSAMFALYLAFTCMRTGTHVAAQHQRMQPHSISACSCKASAHAERKEKRKTTQAATSSSHQLRKRANWEEKPLHQKAHADWMV